MLIMVETEVSEMVSVKAVAGWEPEVLMMCLGLIMDV